MKTTLVTAFVPLSDYKVKSLDEYLIFAKPLLDLKMNKIIFTTGEIINKLKKKSDPYTFWVEIADELLVVPDNLLNLPQNRNPNKDTLDYLLLQNTKPIFLKRAIELDTYNSDSFIWIDFGISHILNDANILEKLNRSYSFNDKIIAAGIWQAPINIDIKNEVCWVFAGGIIGGKSPVILDFYNECMRQFDKNIESNFITWEVNVWYQVYLNRPDLFKLYQSDHNESMILNFP